ncbi:MAG: pyrroline-5-carboxylate reductase [Tannerella sp.]|nr:pyrroline-5-carboxylate reductase [Tannerella sp.]
MKISIIGAGSIGSALCTGLLREGSSRPADITLTDVVEDFLEPFAVQGVMTMHDNIAAVKDADIIILCIKPLHAAKIIEDIKPSLKAEALLVSFVAGLSLEKLSRLAGKRALFRVIPNTAIAICQSMSCIVPSENATTEQKDTILQLFSRVGKAILIEESLMDAATVIASCGTAFALRYLRAAMNAAVEIGLHPSVAGTVIAQTMLGAALLVAETGNHPEAEIDKVTTPEGITIKGLAEMERAGFSLAVMQGIYTANDKLKM